MPFDHVLPQVLELLARQGWTSYQTLRRRFGLDEAALAALTQHLLATQPVTVDDTGTRLVWQGELRPASGPTRSIDVVTATPSGAGAAPGLLGGEKRQWVTPLVGRTQEVELLRARWARVQAGQGQVVGLHGEAGIGKSRLVQVVRAYVAELPHRGWLCRGVATAQYSAFYPVMDLLQQVLDYHPEDSPAVQLQKLEILLASCPGVLPEAVSLLATLLAVPLDDRSPPLTLTPERQRQCTLETLLTVLRGLAAHQPVLLIVEDLHWVDPSTLELLSLLVAQAATARLYVLLTWRPELQLPWPPPVHQTTLTLGRLLPAQVEQLATQGAGGKVLPPAVLEQMVVKTEGVPLFVEELTQMVLVSGLVREEADRYVLTGPLPRLALPPTVQASLVARLEQLGEAKAVAQVGAVWGRGFTEAQLQAVAPVDRRRLDQALARLVEADILREVPLPPRLTYVFKHALLQEAAYASMPLDRRQQVHGQVAQVLEARFPEAVETQPELLAQHYTAAGLIAQAIAYWQRAGQQAVQRSAHVEAISHLTQGLALLTSLPYTPERPRRELDLLVALGPALMATRGYAAPEVVQAYARARELCQQVGETPEYFPVLWNLAVFYRARSEHQTSMELSEQCLQLAQRVQDEALLLEAHLMVGVEWFWLGNPALACTHLEHTIALYDPEQHHVLVYHYGGFDPGILGFIYYALSLWLRGYPAQARAYSARALSLAQQLTHPYTLVRTLHYDTLLCQLRRDMQAVHDQAEATITIATAQRFALLEASGPIMRGWAIAIQEHSPEGLVQIQQGLDMYRSTGAEVQRPHFLALLAEASGLLGQPENGLAALEEALTLVEQTGERYYEAELHRQRGELLLLREAKSYLTQDNGDQLDAETCFQHALDVACQQQAKSLELRAAMSLARLWQRRGKRADAYDLLAPIYGWFTEGFDTADLLEAKALLDELA